MKLGAVTLAYRDEGTLRGTLACLNDFVEQHIVIIPNKPFNGEVEPMDRTVEICNQFDKVVVVFTDITKEHEIRNFGNILLKNYDWVVGFDADEMITKEDLSKLKVVMERTNKDAIGFKSKVYWGTTDYILSPDPDHIKVCVVRPSVRFWEKQCVSVPYEIIERDEHQITHHHLSWCYPKDILHKVIHYNHASEFDGWKWYDEHFRNWEFGKEAIQPFGSKWQVVKDPLPDELRALL